MADVTPMPMPIVVAAIHVAVDGFSTTWDPKDHSARFNSFQLKVAVRSVSEHLQHLCSCGQVWGILGIDIEQCKYACLCICERLSVLCKYSRMCVLTSGMACMDVRWYDGRRTAEILVVLFV